MQRRKFIQSTSNLAFSGALPINYFEKIINEVEREKLIQSKTSDSNFFKKTSKIATQTTVVKCNQQDVKIHAVQTGSVAVKKSHQTNHTAHFLTPLKITFDRKFTEFLPIWVWVIEHPEGVFVIDTGENASVMNPNYFKPAGSLISKYSQKNFKFHVEKENEIGFQLRQLGIENDDIKNVVLTHLHLDHTDGIKDFRGVEFILNADEFRQPTGHIPELIPDWFKPKTVYYKKDFTDIFNEAYPLSEAANLLLIPTNGHTRHHASVLFKTDDFDIIFAGDVCYNQQQLLTGDLPGINSNYKKSRATYRKILNYAEQRKLIFLPSHDLDSARRLTEQVFL